jgi:rhodanese-related sulfurtransferase
MQHSSLETIPTLTVAELQLRRRSNPSLILAEALPASYYASGHLPGAINLPHDSSDDTIRAALPNRAAETVVYCASATCPNSHLLAQRLNALGYTRVAVFTDGKAGWSTAGESLER